MIVLDTNVLSGLMRASPHPQVLGWVDREDARGLFVSAVSEAEIRTGLGMLPGGGRRRELAAAADLVLDELFRGRALPFDAAAARVYADIACHRRVRQVDCQIAASAQVDSQARGRTAWRLQRVMSTNSEAVGSM